MQVFASKILTARVTLVCYTAVFCSSVFSSRQWEGALCDDTKDGCVADQGNVTNI